MSASSLGLAVPAHLTDDAAGQVGTKTNIELNREAIDLSKEVLSTSMFEEIVGSSDAICRVTAQVMKVARSDATVPITGESGTGKELIARSIYKKSRMFRSVVTRMNCAVTPLSLIAAGLSGYVPAFQMRDDGSKPRPIAAPPVDVSTETPQLRVAVLPFVDLSKSALSGACTQFLTDDLLHQMVRTDGVRVITGHSERPEGMETVDIPDSSLAVSRAHQAA
jgi:hypothetical protein